MNKERNSSGIDDSENKKKQKIVRKLNRGKEKEKKFEIKPAYEPRGSSGRSLSWFL